MKLKLRYIPLLILGGVVVLSVSVIGVLNVAKFAIYHDYYSREEKFCSIPGIHDNFLRAGCLVYKAVIQRNLLILIGFKRHILYLTSDMSLL